MRKRVRLVLILFLILFSVCSLYSNQGNIDIKAEDTKDIPEELKNLYAQSACLMDADSGRILFSKNGDQIRPMASTTKILTCILALENGNMDELVSVSANAARQPDVQLNIKEGEYYRLEDLLYSLMLESHNDSAVAIAEAVSGSVEQFSALMNQKAEEIGLQKSFFLTPNGLDAECNGREHSTTACELAKILRYCIKLSNQKEAFLKITQTKEYQFHNQIKDSNGNIAAGERTFFCRNHNALFSMMDGVITGKTGFTGKAGYCYVGAVTVEDKTFIVSLLACGWPNNKTYKWKDTKKLIAYGNENFKKVSMDELSKNRKETDAILVRQGQPENLFEKVYLPVYTVPESDIDEKSVLLCSYDKIKIVYHIPQYLEAPIVKKEEVGEVLYCLNGQVIMKEKLLADASIKRLTYVWYVSQLWMRFLGEKEA